MEPAWPEASGDLGRGREIDDRDAEERGRRGHGQGSGGDRATRWPARPAPRRSRSGTACGYAEGTYVASFIGYLPAEDPQVLISVTIDEPTNAIYGGTVAAPTFSKLGQFSVEHLKIPPVDGQEARPTTEHGEARCRRSGSEP